MNTVDHTAVRAAELTLATQQCRELWIHRPKPPPPLPLLLLLLTMVVMIMIY